MFAIHFDTCFINKTIGSQTNNYHKQDVNLYELQNYVLCFVRIKN